MDRFPHLIIEPKIRNYKSTQPEDDEVIPDLLEAIVINNLEIGCEINVAFLSSISSSTVSCRYLRCSTGTLRNEGMRWEFDELLDNTRRAHQLFLEWNTASTLHTTLEVVAECYAYLGYDDHAYIAVNWPR